MKKIRETLEFAEDAAFDEADVQGHPYANGRKRIGHYEAPAAALEEFLNDIFLDLRSLAEKLELQEYRDAIKDYDTANSKSYGSVLFNPETDSSYGLGVDEARRFLKSILAAVGMPSASAESFPFENILKATATILERAKAVPNNEKQVRDPVVEIVKLAYPDAVISNHIHKPGKSYVPDITVKSVHSVAEYKFARDRVGLKAAYDELAADMAGYSGDPDILFKYAVIFTPTAFATEEEVRAHFDSVGKPDDWTIFLRHG